MCTSMYIYTYTLYSTLRCGPRNAPTDTKDRWTVGSATRVEPLAGRVNIIYIYIYTYISM